MTYQKHLKVVFGGVLGETASAPQGWSISTRWNLVGGGYDARSQDTMDSIAASVEDAATTFFTSNVFTDQVWWTYCKAYSIESNGGSADNPIGVFNVDDPDAGSAGAEKPFQVSWVVSLDATGRGSGKAGRFFLPCPAPAVERDGTVLVASAIASLALVKDFLDDVDSAIGGSDLAEDVQLVIASGKGTGTLHPVTELRLGRILDTQRRRRDKGVEDYQTLDYG